MRPTTPRAPAAACRMRVVMGSMVAARRAAAGQASRQGCVKVPERCVRSRTMAQLLVVEDDEAIAEPLVRALAREGHDVARGGSGERALELIARRRRRPGRARHRPAGDRRRRGLPPRRASAAAAAGADADRAQLGARRGARPRRGRRRLRDQAVLALGAGWRAYARCCVATRRRRRAVLEAAGVRLDRPARRAWRGERELELSPKEFDLLALLVANAGTVVPARADHGRGLGRELVGLDARRSTSMSAGCGASSASPQPLDDGPRRRLPLRAGVARAPPAARLDGADRARCGAGARAAAGRSSDRGCCGSAPSSGSSGRPMRSSARLRAAGRVRCPRRPGRRSTRTPRRGIGSRWCFRTGAGIATGGALGGEVIRVARGQRHGVARGRAGSFSRAAPRTSVRSGSR